MKRADTWANSPIRFLMLVLFSVILLLTFLWHKDSPPTFAACNINLADWSEASVRTCIAGGGTVAFVGYYGDYGGYIERTWSIINEHNNANPGNQVVPEFRFYNGDQSPPTNEEISAFVATVAQYSQGPWIARVNNEPTDGYVWSGYSHAETIAEIARTQYALYQAQLSCQCEMLRASEMLDLWNGTDPRQTWAEIEAYINSNPDLFPGWDSYHDTYDVYSINGYFETGERPFGDFGTVQLADILSALPPGKAWRFSEFGYKPSGGRPTYDQDKLEQTLIEFAAWLQGPGAQFAENFAGFGIFTEDPHAPTANLSQFLADLAERVGETSPAIKGALAYLANLTFRNTGVIEDWIAELIELGVLQECLDVNGKVVGFAPGDGDCEVDFELPDDDNLGPQYVCSVQGKDLSELEGTFRPEPCENCRLNVPEPVNSCSATTTISKLTENITCGDVEECGDGFIYREDWTFDLILDTAETKVPFADYKNAVKEITEAGFRSKSLNDYINSYLIGTALYDGEVFNATNKQDVTNLVWEAGVARKIFPEDVQTRIKIDLINKGYNYEIKQAGLKMQEWRIGGRYSRYNPSGRLPPEPTDPRYTDQDEYLADKKAWGGTVWGQYWPYVPMFRRDDAPGKAVLTIQHKPGELTPSGVGVNTDPYTVEIPLSIPHLTRMYDVTKAVNEYLLPEIEEAVGQVPVAQEVEREGCVSDFGQGIETALGCIPTSAQGFVAWILSGSLSIVGGIAFILMVAGALLMMSSTGDPEKLQQARQVFTAAVVGLVFIVFSIFMIRFLFGRIFEIPGFETSYQRLPMTQFASIDSTGNVRLAAKTQRGVTSSANLASSSKFSEPKYTYADSYDAASVGNYETSTSCQDPNLPEPKVVVERLMAQTGREIVADTSDPVLLAQAGGGACEQEFASDQCGLVVEQNGFVKMYNSTRCSCGQIADFAMTVEYSIDGGAWQVACSEAIMNGELFPQAYDGRYPLYNVTDNLGYKCGKIGGVDVTTAASDSFKVRVTTSSGRGDCQGPVTREATVVKQAGGAWQAVGCGQTEITPPEPVDNCSNPDEFNPSECSEEALEDINPNLDEVCCTQGVSASVTNYVSSVPREVRDDLCECEAFDALGNCLGRELENWQTMQSRKIENKLKIPYLGEAWDYTAGDMGFFQLFRPDDLDRFPDAAAKTDISYEIRNTRANGSIGEEAVVSPETGDFYFPYLGGLQMTKKCISETVLTPEYLQGPTDWCDFSNSAQNPFTRDLSEEEEFTKFGYDHVDEYDEDGCTELDPDFAQSVTVLDPGASIDSSALESKLTYYSQRYGVSHGNLKEQAQTVISTSIANGFNPVLALTFWIEESHMGLAPGARAQFGCLDGNNQMDLTSNLQCLLSRPYANEDFESFMLKYSGDTAGKFCRNPNFPVNVTKIYQQLRG